DQAIDMDSLGTGAGGVPRESGFFIAVDPGGSKHQNARFGHRRHYSEWLWGAVWKMKAESQSADKRRMPNSGTPNAETPKAERRTEARLRNCQTPLNTGNHGCGSQATIG